MDDLSLFLNCSQVSIHETEIYFFPTGKYRVFFQAFYSVTIVAVW